MVCLKSGWAANLITAPDWHSFKHECLQTISSRSTVKEPQDESLVRRATEIIQSNVRGVTVVTLASALGCHRRTLERAFRRVRDEWLHHFLMLVRTQVAVELLTQTDWTCEAIARDVGFRSRTTLNVAVKQTTGRTPHQLRNAGVERVR